MEKSKVTLWLLALDINRTLHNRVVTENKKVILNNKIIGKVITFLGDKLLVVEKTAMSPRELQYIKRLCTSKNYNVIYLDVFYESNIPTSEEYQEYFYKALEKAIL